LFLHFQALAWLGDLEAHPWVATLAWLTLRCLQLQLWKVYWRHLRTLHLQPPDQALPRPVLASCLQVLWVEATLASHLGVLEARSNHPRVLLLVVRHLRKGLAMQLFTK
jgi:hypothetical protein